MIVLDKKMRTNACLYLPPLEEALLVTVGDVQRERQDPGGVLHALNEVVQSSPARPLRSRKHR